MALDSASANKRSVLVVDDEASIRKILEGIFRDEGYAVYAAPDGETALALVEQNNPDLVLLDIWMPGLDGIETLKRLKALAPATGVIMISGHATIATAIMATRLGAADFIEKPLDLNVILEAVTRVLGEHDKPERAKHYTIAPDPEETLAIGQVWHTGEINRVVFSSQPMKGAKIRQRTLAQSALLYGQGLHSGKKSGIIFEPLPENSGIHFVGISETTAVPAHVDFVGSTGFATTLKLGRTQAGTIEHIMSALHAYGISNLLIKCNGEVPVMDGSSREFCALFDAVGTQEQDGDWYEIEVRKTLTVGNDREFIRLEPADTFSIEYTLDYPAPVGRQRRAFTLSGVEGYRKEIAAARTFGFVRDIGALQKQGLALGGRFDNFVLIGEEGPINDDLRFPDEPVRHKILDAIGDLYLLGRRIRGKVTAQMTGHSDNIAILRALSEQMRKEG